MFKDRLEAGQQLAKKLEEYTDNADALILAVPRGALEIAHILSHQLHLPLDVILTKKIGYPGNPECSIGAVSLENIIIDKRGLEFSGHMEEYLKQEIANIRQLLRERSAIYHAHHPPLSLQGKIVIVVDDGIATGKTLEATIDLIKKQNPKKIVVAVPVASKESLHSIRKKVDEVICLEIPDMFVSVSQSYQNFDQVDDEQAIQLLEQAYQ